MLFAPSLPLVLVYDGLDHRPPNGVLTLVNSLATKRHRTMHNVDTDEVMVRGIRQCAVGLSFTKPVISIHSSIKTPMGQNRKANTSWADVIGAASR